MSFATMRENRWRSSYTGFASKGGLRQTLERDRPAKHPPTLRRHIPDYDVHRGTRSCGGDAGVPADDAREACNEFFSRILI